MDNRQDKIRLLSRKNRERAATPAFLKELSTALGESVDEAALLPPEDADVILASFRSGYQSAIRSNGTGFRRYFLAEERNLVMQVADCLAERLSGARGVFLTKVGTDRRAVDINISTLLGHTASILRLDGDSLCVVSEDRNQGVLIDHNPDDPIQAYELAVWGQRWLLLAAVCSQSCTERKAAIPSALD